MGALDPIAAWSGWSPKEVKKHRVSVYKLADGTFEAFAGNSDIPAGAELLSPQPKMKTSGDPHEGTRVALKKLESQYPGHVAWACHLAVMRAKERLTVHSRDVRDEMERRGMLKPHEPEFWLGAAFNRLKRDLILKPTGQNMTYSDASRGIHERTIKIWGLVEHAPTGPYEIEPKPLAEWVVAPAGRGRKK